MDAETSTSAMTSPLSGDPAPAAGWPPPLRVIADVLLDRVAAEHPGLLAEASRPSTVTVFETAAAELVDPLADAFRDRNPPIRSTEGRRASGRLRRDVDGAWWLEYRGTGAGSDADREAEVLGALGEGFRVVAFASAPSRQLPPILLEAADRWIRVPALDADAVVEVVRRLTGRLPTATPDAELLAAATPRDVALAARPGEGADGILSRLAAILGRRRRLSGPRLGDLHGMDEAVRWGEAVAADLRAFASGRLAWSDVDRGCLLAGPPGTGKTTFAKALAATAELPLVTGSLAAWQAAGHLGDLLREMRAAFASARGQAPCFLFVDELDSFGDRRVLPERNRDYGVQVINGFLEELDGIAGRPGVVVIGACNHPHLIDPAILRSGRLDRVVVVGLPDEDALARILRMHLDGDLRDADLAGVAAAALGASGADCERFVRGARRRARTERREMRLEDLVAEIEGPAPALSEEDRWRVAVHEAGHALMLVRSGIGRVARVTVGSRGGGLGRVVGTGSPALLTRARLDAHLQCLLAGRAAEVLMLGSPSAGAGGDPDSDLAQATRLAALAVGSWGLSAASRGAAWYGDPGEDWGDMLRLPAVEPEVGAILAHAHGAAMARLAAERTVLVAIARALAAEGALDGRRILALAGTPASDQAEGPPERRIRR